MPLATHLYTEVHRCSRCGRYGCGHWHIIPGGGVSWTCDLLDPPLKDPLP